MSDHKSACLVYVTATESLVASVHKTLEEQGYSVCAVKAEIEDALAAQAEEGNIPDALTDCITSSDLCVFILPEDKSADGLLGSGAGLANEMAKRVIGVVAGGRSDYPEPFDDRAHSMVREESDRLEDAICGTEIWEKPDRTPTNDRPIKHIKCQ